MNESVTRLVYGVLAKVGRKKPEIMLGTGLLILVGGSVVAAVSAKKARPVLEKLDNNLNEIQNCIADENTEYSKVDAAKDTVEIVAQTGVGLTKVFGPVVLMDVVGCGLVLKAFGIVRHSEAIAIASLKCVMDAYGNYRNSVRNEIGEERENELYYGIEHKEIEYMESDENGEVRIVKGIGKVVSTFPGCSPLAKMFDAVNTTSFRNTPMMNKDFIIGQENWSRNYLRAHDHLYLNQVYEWLGFEHTDLGAVYGWIYDRNDPEGSMPKFGLEQVWRPGVKEFLDGYERSVILDFNAKPILGLVGN